MLAADTQHAVEEDWPAICEQLESAGLPVRDLDSSKMTLFFVARSDRGQCLGAIGLECFGTVGLLRSLVVANRARGLGLGRRLVARLEQYAVNRGITELWLLTIDADNFFRSIDFVTVNRSDAPESIRSTTEFSDLCPASAFLMRKILSTNS